MGDLDLEDEAGLRSIDRSGMIDLLLAFPEQCREAARLGAEECVPWRGEVSHIVVCGLGGSAMGGDLLRCVAGQECPVPIAVSRAYTLPRYVGPQSLLFVISYSGNTEETLAAFQEGVERRARLVAITSGGRLQGLAEEAGVPVIRVPAGLPPRQALGYLFFPMLRVLTATSLLPERVGEVDRVVETLQALRLRYQPRQGGEGNLAKALARRLLGWYPRIYGTQDHTEAVAWRWKCQFNENSKILAAAAVFPELNHNEIEGLLGLEKVRRALGVVVLRDADDPPRMGQRIACTLTMLQGKVGEILEVWSEGECRLARLLSLIYLGDFVSYYLALLNGVDPSPVPHIEQFKRDMARL